MKIEMQLTTGVPDTFRTVAARSMYNVLPEQARTHEIKADVPLEDRPWTIGLVVGPSGSGKTSIGSKLGSVWTGCEWSNTKAIIDEVGGASTDDAAAALAAVGLGTVPAWLRPFHVLSGGEKFRAELARILLAPTGGAPVVYDEFTSVVDRVVAQVGAGAFAKAWRRRPDGSKFVALACHYDIEEWLQPDWVLDTSDWTFRWGALQRRPKIEIEVHEAPREAWALFAPHHYLKAGLPAGKFYVAMAMGRPVAHVALTTAPPDASGRFPQRLTRLVVMPEWQGAGIGIAFLEAVAKHAWSGGYKPCKSLAIHTSHPGLIAALSRRPNWTRVRSKIGENSSSKNQKNGHGRGFLRAVSGFAWRP